MNTLLLLAAMVLAGYLLGRYGHRRTQWDYLRGRIRHEAAMARSITNVLRKWIDKRRYDVVWLHREDIDYLESWAKNVAQQRHRFRKYETPKQPIEGWTPAQPWAKS